MSPAEEGGTTLADVRRVLEVGLTAANGRLDVILSRLEQQDKRADQHEGQIAGLDTRLDAVERTATTRDETDTIKMKLGTLETAAVTRADMDARSRKTISIVAVVVTIIVALVGTLTTVVITLVT
jgi:hypothetical protein